MQASAGTYANGRRCTKADDLMHVVFYRNLNLGHAGSPNREQLEGALERGGALRVRSFQTNGTVLLEAEAPEGVVAAAAGELGSLAGYDDAAIVRSLADLERVLALGVFEKHQSPPYVPRNRDILPGRHGAELVDTVDQLKRRRRRAAHRRRDRPEPDSQTP